MTRIGLAQKRKKESRTKVMEAILFSAIAIFLLAWFLVFLCSPIVFLVYAIFFVETVTLVEWVGIFLSFIWYWRLLYLQLSSIVGSLKR